MIGLIAFVHIAACLLLIVIVLLQHGKGADAGAALGGGQSAVFGARGAASFLSKLTTACAVVFMVSSLTLVYLSSQQANQTVFDGTESATTPSEALENVAEKAASGISEDAKEVAEDAKGMANEAIETGKAVASDAAEATKEAAKDIKDAAVETVNEAAKEIEEATKTKENN